MDQQNQRMAKGISDMYRDRGYFGIGIENVKSEVNVGTLWRTANCFGTAFIFTIGRRYKKKASDTMNTPKHVPLYNYSSFDDFYGSMPKDCQLVGLEICETSKPLETFCHPERAIYLLGPEDGSLSNRAAHKCHHIIRIASRECLNVSTAGSIALYDRKAKEIQK